MASMTFLSMLFVVWSPESGKLEVVEVSVRFECEEQAHYICKRQYCRTGVHQRPCVVDIDRIIVKRSGYSAAQSACESRSVGIQRTTATAINGAVSVSIVEDCGSECSNDARYEKNRRHSGSDRVKSLLLELESSRNLLIYERQNSEISHKPKSRIYVSFCLSGPKILENIEKQNEENV